MNDTEQRIAGLYDFSYWISPNLNPNLGKSEPPANVRVPGLLAYADGSTWNPGLGAGVFIWNGSAWKEFYGTWNLTPYTGPTVQNDVTASRVLGTVYQNTTGKPMWVCVAGNASTSAGNFFAYTDSSNPPTKLISKQVMYVLTNSSFVFFIVLPNNYYKVDYDGGVIKDSWVEWY